MVWGLVESSSFGDYFPDGDYVGWEEAIKRYFDEEMTTEQRAAFDHWDVSYRSEVARKFNEDMGPLEPHERPNEYRLIKTYQSLGALIELNNRLLAVSEPLKDIIEALEPGVHQFWPIRITMPKGKEYPTPYYGLRIGRFLDSFLPEQSEDYRSPPDIKTYYANSYTKKGYACLCVAESVAAGCHLWRERWLRQPKILFSDDLMADVERRALRFPKHHKLKAI
ncbi:imm11 family protein [Agrobacterium sp. NPDC090283]|uniref:imm11 family protein n=1 Tax=Agrobacterium sp. NPDC090283 TaxID=3363920 RepID=UPI00383B7A7F